MYGRLNALCAIILSLLLAACAGSGQDQSDSNSLPTLTVWHSYAPASDEVRVFDEAIKQYRKDHPEIAIETVGLPYSQLVPQFITASQGGEAPDLVRITDNDLSQLGIVSVNGVNIIEDLRPHLTPAETSDFIATTLKAMRLEGRLLALPASQSTLSMLYNPALFARHGKALPDEDWTITDWIAAAEKFEDTPVDGLTFPSRRALWVFPFMTAMGGDLFSASGQPQFDRPGMADALEYLRALEFDRKLLKNTNVIDATKTKFITSQTAMIVDGAWNVGEYRAAGIDVAQVLLPRDANTGNRMKPVNGVLGWSLSAQSPNKVAAVELAKYLVSQEVQQAFLDRTLSIPTSIEVANRARASSDRIVAGYTRQAEHSVILPKNKGTPQLYVLMDTAVHLAITGDQTSRMALRNAQAELQRAMQ